jgi:hypothetical protein
MRPLRYRQNSMATLIPYSQFLGSNDPFPVLENTPRRVAEIASTLEPQQMATHPDSLTVGSGTSMPGRWSIHQIVAHLADTELVSQTRVRMMLFEDTPALAAYDQDRWVNGWQRENESFEDTLERFRVLRESTIRLFRATPEHDLRRVGTHAERGVQTAGDYLIILAGHDINHLSQIEAIRAAWQAAHQR